MTRSGVESSRPGDGIRHRNQFGLGPDVLVAAAVLGWGAVAHRFVPERVRPLAGAVAAAGLAAAVRGAGVDARAIGCDPDDIPRGLRWGAAVAGGTTAVIAGLRALDRSGTRFQDERVSAASGGEAAFHLLVRIPLATALVEELTFRGVILGLGRRSGDARRALVVSSLAFGLWHVGAALHPARTAAAGEIVGDHGGTAAAAVAGDVVATTIGGIGFGWLRLKSGSIAAPALAHAALNASAYAAARIRAGRVRSTSAR
jgi:membrane protease YdiL (CAAX protease family)